MTLIIQDTAAAAASINNRALGLGWELAAQAFNQARNPIGLGDWHIRAIDPAQHDSDDLATVFVVEQAWLD